MIILIKDSFHLDPPIPHWEKHLYEPIGDGLPPLRVEKYKAEFEVVAEFSKREEAAEFIQELGQAYKQIVEKWRAVMDEEIRAEAKRIIEKKENK